MEDFSTELRWHHRDEKMPDKSCRILVCSPDYDINDPFRFRVIDSQFLKISKDAKYWAYIITPWG